MKVNYVYIFKNIEVEKESSIGIIDGKSCGEYSEVIYNKITNTNIGKSHGDAMIQFAQEICPNIKIFYFDASDENNRIKDENIIDGIRWMIDKGVQYINISLSSKKYSESLNEIIHLNNKVVNVYSSYNNLTNSFDYPSMYKDVIASGYINKNMEYKKNDEIYHSNKIIVFPYDYNIKYMGNSYLSMLTMLRDVEGKY